MNIKKRLAIVIGTVISITSVNSYANTTDNNSVEVNAHTIYEDINSNYRKLTQKARADTNNQNTSDAHDKCLNRKESVLRYINRVQPKYPKKELAKGRIGRVRIKFVVNDAGKAEDIVVIKKTSTAFAKEAVKALKQSRFTVRADSNKCMVNKKEATLVSNLDDINKLSINATEVDQVNNSMFTSKYDRSKQVAIQEFIFKIKEEK